MILWGSYFEPPPKSVNGKRLGLGAARHSSDAHRIA